MGHEAECACNWNGAVVRVKALVEPPELILRGAIKRRIPFANMQQVRADGGTLHFEFEGDTITLTLGFELAAKWVTILTASPPSLAKKLGITPETTVRMLGEVDDDALRDALSTAKAVGSGDGDLILARVNTPHDLAAALKTAKKQLADGVPIWLIYRKGKGHAIAESDVRGAGLAAGIVDTKVAAVSAVLTGLRFVKRRS